MQVEPLRRGMGHGREARQDEKDEGEGKQQSPGLTDEGAEIERGERAASSRLYGGSQIATPEELPGARLDRQCNSPFPDKPPR